MPLMRVRPSHKSKEKRKAAVLNCKRLEFHYLLSLMDQNPTPKAILDSTHGYTRRTECKRWSMRIQDCLLVCKVCMKRPGSQLNPETSSVLVPYILYFSIICPVSFCYNKLSKASISPQMSPF